MKINLNLLNISLQEAIDKAKPGDEIILKENYRYFEKITITTPNLTLTGNNSIIECDKCHSSIKEDGTKHGTSGSATMLIKEGADYFKATGITVVNSHKRSENDQNQAVAFKSEISNLYLSNCRFISTQDTFYVDYGTNNTVIDCYIEGDIDFVFGSADCVFRNCMIHAINHKVAYFTAPSTYVCNNHGLVFRSCNFTSATDKAILGRKWYPKDSKKPILPKLHFLGCSFTDNIVLELITMHQGDPEAGILKVKRCIQNFELINPEMELDETERFVYSQEK